MNEWKWSWKYMEWQLVTASHAVCDVTRNPLRIWRNQ